MRNLFLTLVLANLAFTAWHQWFTEGPASGGHAAQRELEGITLVREAVGRGDVPAARSEPLDGTRDAERIAFGAGIGAQPSAAGLVQERCVSVGPFRELAQAAAATSNLRAANHQPRQRVVEGEVWQGYWVYLDGFGSAEEANGVLAELRAQGFSDSYVIRGSESSLVSLGIFSEIGRAGRHREALRELGYEATIADRTGRATVYWVDVTLAPDQTLDVEALQTTGRIIRLEQRACDAVG